MFNRLSFYGAKDAIVQTFGSFFGLQRTWDYSNGRPVIETNESITPSATLRGGWQLSGAVSRSGFAYDPQNYSGYRVVPNSPFDDSRFPVAFTVPGFEADQFGGSFRVTTPTLRFFSATTSVSRGKTPIFREAAPGRSTRIDGALDLRPTTSLRASVQFSRLTLERSRDDSRFSTETIPRLKMEYQVNQALFLRLVGQYAARSRSALRDRNGNVILIDGELQPATSTNEFSMDWLFSYRPIPGTLVYLGYGSTMEEAREFRFQDLRRTRDGFFGKLSYLFRF